MIALVANLVERSRGQDLRLKLSTKDYNAIAGGKVCISIFLFIIYKLIFSLIFSLMQFAPVKEEAPAKKPAAKKAPAKKAAEKK